MPTGAASRPRRAARRWRLRVLGIATSRWTGGNVLESADGGSAGRRESKCFPPSPEGQGIAEHAGAAVWTCSGADDNVRVVLCVRPRRCFGSAGSRSLFTGGSSLHLGAEKTLDQARELAGQALEASPHDLQYAGGRFSVKGTDVGIDLFELAGRQPERRIFIDHTSAVAGPSWPNACHVAEVEIDPTTGEVQVVAYSSVNDIGRVVNPMIVRGQLDGGALQGIGQALCEHMVYDRESGQPLTGSLMDYAAPRFDILQCDFRTEMNQTVPSKNNPLGVKGVGELGTIGATRACGTRWPMRWRGRQERCGPCLKCR